MKYLTLGILAHVDAGKTTLCERLLYKNNLIKSFGRVDKNESFLDYEPLERKRGITIFSKQAILKNKDTSITLLDTPGHGDFVWETLSCIQVMDAALLIIDASSSISAFTIRLYRLLRKNKIPTIVFLNKCDLSGDYREDIISRLKQEGAHPIEYSKEEALEEIALCDEGMLEKYLEQGTLSSEDVCNLFGRCLFTPVFCGSALHDEGIDKLNNAIFSIVSPRSNNEGDYKFFPFKTRYDERNNPFIYGKVFNPFKVKEKLDQEKIEEIRLYSGQKWEQLNEAHPGMIVAIRGPEEIKVNIKGEGAYTPLIEYEMIIPETEDIHAFSDKLLPISQENPYLSLRYDAKRSKIILSPMGDIQLEVLKDIILERFGTEVSFIKSGVIYKETVAATVEGVGHFEPLRHYAEVHLLLEPNPGRGIEIKSEASTDMLAANWQSQVLSVLKGTSVPGVLIGAGLTDIKITLVSGKAHEKHTEGGDFREATLRALRQGLMQGECILLEPVYSYEIRIPSDCLGKVMMRLDGMNAESNPPEYLENIAVIKGSFPVSRLDDFPIFLTSVTSGAGELSLDFGGYIPCEETETIVSSVGYEAERDTLFPADSVFTSHGGSDIVHWKDVPDRMHLPFFREDTKEHQDKAQTIRREPSESGFIGLEEIEAILYAAGGSNKRRTKEDRRSHWNRYSKTDSALNNKRDSSSGEFVQINIKEKPEEYLLVDGYNVIFAWEDLKELSEKNIDSARELLCDILDEYAAYKHRRVIVVFDAYKVNGGVGSCVKWGEIDVIYTKEAETADAYIERSAHEITGKYKVFVATSDRLEQMIVRGAGAYVMSAGDLLLEIKEMEKEIREYLDFQNKK